MKFYITLASKAKLKRSFSNLKVFSVISVDSMMEEHGYSYDSIDQIGVYFLNNMIVNQITTYLRSKRSRGIIYSYTHMNEGHIVNLKKVLREMANINSLVLIDDNSERCEKLHHLFDEVVYISQTKKTRLIESNALSSDIEQPE